MNNFLKRTLSLFLASILITGAMPLTVFAKTEYSVTRSGHYLGWTDSNGKLHILEPNETFGAYAYVANLSYAQNEKNATAIGKAYNEKR